MLHKSSKFESFGSPMPGREFSGSAYRYSFNGQEKDDEVSGNGNSYTAEYWQYDSRLGRRWNIDPIRGSAISIYACFDNNPIFYNDIKGNTVNPTNKESEKAVSDYIGTFDTKDKNGETKKGSDLFGISERKEGGVFRSELTLSVKKFTKRAEKAGLEGDKLKDAVDFYKVLSMKDIVEVGTLGNSEELYTYPGQAPYKTVSTIKIPPLYILADAQGTKAVADIGAVDEFIKNGKSKNDMRVKQGDGWVVFYSGQKKNDEGGTYIIIIKSGKINNNGMKNFINLMSTEHFSTDEQFDTHMKEKKEE